MDTLLAWPIHGGTDHDQRPTEAQEEGVGSPGAGYSDPRPLEQGLESGGGASLERGQGHHSSEGLLILKPSTGAPHVQV